LVGAIHQSDAGGVAVDVFVDLCPQSLTNNCNNAVLNSQF